MIEKQKEMESSYVEPSPKSTEMLPPQPCTDFNTARLFLSHFGFLSRLDDTNVIILEFNNYKAYYIIKNYFIFEL